MQFGPEQERLFFKLSLKKPKYLSLIKREYYDLDDVGALHYVSTKFYDKFHETPSIDQCKLLVRNSVEAKGVSDSLIEAVYAVDLTSFDEEWLLSNIEAWIKWRTFNTTMMDTIEYIKSSDPSPDNVENIITRVKTLINDRNSIIFNSDLGLDFFNPDDHSQEQSIKVSTGYNFLDRVLNGGYDKDGTLVVYVGEQNIGKCLSFNGYITIRESNKTKSIKIGELFDLVKSSKNDNEFVDFLEEIDTLEYNTEKSNKNIHDILNTLELTIESERIGDGVNRKFKETFNVDNIEVLTQNGFVKINEIGKTEKYLKYTVKTTNHTLECADDHIVIDSEWDQIFVKNLNKGTRRDMIMTVNGPEQVIEVINTGEYEEMYDISLDKGSDNLYYTSGILSHNSIYLANDAANFVKMGTNTAVITAEMSSHKFMKRIASNLLSIDISEYDVKSKNVDLIKRKLESIGDGLTPPGQLFVKQFPTSQATVLDIEAYLKQIEEERKIKLGAIVIDYINILANYRNVNTENTYMKIKQIAEDLRAMGVRNGWLIVTATQINRNNYNSSDLTMKDVAESAGLSHTADIMLGIIQDDIMRAGYEYWLKILKIRDGEGKGHKCKLNINYNYMRLTETDEVSTSNIHEL